MSGSPSTRAVSSRLDKFLKAAPVAAMSLAAGHEAQAQVVTFPITGHSITPGFSTKLSDLNITTGYGSPTLAPYLTFEFVANSKAEKPKAIPGFGAQVMKTGPFIDRLSYGTTISSGGFFGTGNIFFEYNNAGPWNGSASTTMYYVGLRIPNGGDYNYGWLATQYDDSSNTLTFSQIAWEQTAGVGLTAGVTAIPEPATNAFLLAAGAAGIAAYRRRKKQAA